MNELGQRIQVLRKAKNWSQGELAKQIKISYPQMSRYEIKGVQPPANVLQRLAEALDTTVDYLISGDKTEKAKASLKDAELLQQFRQVEQLSDKDKSVIKTLIDAFLTKRQIQQLAK
jgi:transcriptional regulator with XRE-family HTH domain